MVAPGCAAPAACCDASDNTAIARKSAPGAAEIARAWCAPNNPYPISPNRIGGCVISRRQRGPFCFRAERNDHDARQKQQTQKRARRFERDMPLLQIAVDD